MSDNQSSLDLTCTSDLQEARQDLSSAEEMLETSRSIAENAQRTLARVEAEAAAAPDFSANPNAANFVQQQAAMQEVRPCPFSPQDSVILQHALVLR